VEERKRELCECGSEVVEGGCGERVCLLCRKVVEEIRPYRCSVCRVCGGEMVEEVDYYTSNGGINEVKTGRYVCVECGRTDE